MHIFRSKRVQNAGNPRGFWGKQTLRAMNRSHDALTDWGLGFVDINGEEKILDIGCGGGKTVSKLAKTTAGTVWGIDRSATAVRESLELNRKAVANNQVIICQGSVSAMPFEDETFDLITAVETYYFWPSPEKDFREISRVLKVGGKLMVLCEMRADAPNPRSYREILKTVDLRLPTADNLAMELKAAGFCDIIAHVRGNALCVTAEKSHTPSLPRQFVLNRITKAKRQLRK